MLLAIDTATRTGSVALAERGRIVAHRVLDTHAQHGSSLATTVESLGIDLSQLEAFALTIGPGSFTGLRIALAFVKGIALVVPRPVHAISTLEVLAEGLARARPEARLFLPLLDARRGEVYAALFVRDVHRGLVPDPRVVEGVYPLGTLTERVRAELAGEPLWAAGDGVLLDFGTAPPPWSVAEAEHSVPDARILAELAYRRQAAGDRGTDASALEPVYLMTPPGER